MKQAVADVRVVADQVYSHVGGRERLADLYLPVDAESPVPVVIWLHGGGWRYGDRRLAPDLAQFAQQSSLAVVSIDYRLSDEARFPAAVQDVKTAVRWVRRVASGFGLDARRIGLWGSSAGGHLAACAALSEDGQFSSGEYRDCSSLVQAVVDGYGPCDFSRIDEDRGAMRQDPSDAETLLVGKVVPAGDPDSFESRFLGVPVSTSPEQVKLADPVHYLRPGAPPFLILHGRADTLIPCTQSRYIFDALSAAGADATLVLFQNLKHGFFNYKDLAEQEYGSVNVFRSDASAEADVWNCNPAERIPSMVSSFFQFYLCPSRDTRVA